MSLARGVEGSVGVASIWMEVELGSKMFNPGKSSTLVEFWVHIVRNFRYSNVGPD